MPEDRDRDTGEGGTAAIQDGPPHHGRAAGHDGARGHARLDQRGAIVEKRRGCRHSSRDTAVQRRGAARPGREEPPTGRGGAAGGLPAVSVTVRVTPSPGCAASVAVKAPAVVATTVTCWPVRVLRRVTRAPPSTLPGAPVRVTCPLVTGPTVRRP